jgi:hypothetical protein
VAAWGLASCVSSYEHSASTTYHVRQAALVPAPTPMYADAPLAPRGGVALEGGVTFAQAEPGGERLGGAGGHVVPVTTLRGRVAWRPTSYVELAFAGEGASGAWASPHARDVDASGFDYTEVFRLGPQVRVVFNPRHPLRVGLSAAGLFGRIPWGRDITSTGTSRAVDPRTGAVVYESGGAGAESLSDASAFAWANLAVFLTGDIGGRASVLGGVSVQNQPAAFGYKRTEQSCYTPAGTFWPSCSGRTPSEVPALESAFASTAFVSGELRLGAGVSLVGRFHAVLAGSPQVTAPGRFGGGLDLRATFGP